MICVQNRIGLCDRSFAKEKFLPQKKNFFGKKLYNHELNKYPEDKMNIEEATKDLDKSGKKLIKTFIGQFEKKKQQIMDNEEQLYKYKHSKPPLQINPWKFSNHVINEFSRPKIDQEYSFKEEVKKKYDYTVEPFRRPGDHGDYFDKHIGII